jgi:thiol-disulfide isomerase/thioredoxin
MRKLLVIALGLFSFTVFSQEMITDANFEEKVNARSAFTDDNVSIVVVEFWASFNAANQFNEHKKLEGVTYYRCDISKAPNSKKKHKVKTIPHIVIFKDGIDEAHFKAGIGFALTATLEEIQEAVKGLKTASKF